MYTVWLLIGLQWVVLLAAAVLAELHVRGESHRPDVARTKHPETDS